MLLGGDETQEKTNGTNPSTSKLDENIIRNDEDSDECKSLKLKYEQDNDDDDGDKEKSKENTRPTIILHSHKMKELKDLLLAEKLNTHAISLHLTAQSQVQVGKKSRGENDGNNLRPKRVRRE